MSKCAGYAKDGGRYTSIALPLAGLAARMPTFFYPTRQLDSTITLLWQNLSCLDPTTVAFCCDPWRRLRLVIDGEKMQLDGQTLAVTPAAEARAVSAESLRPYNWLWFWPWPAPSPPGPAVELTVPPRRFALCAPTEEERARLLQRLRDAIDLSHGPASPYAEWAFGEVLGEGTFGTVRAVTHRASGGECAVKIMSRSSLDRQCDAKLALAREQAIMLKLQAQLGAASDHAPLLQLRQLVEFHDSIMFFITPRCTVSGWHSCVALANARAPPHAPALRTHTPTLVRCACGRRDLSGTLAAAAAARCCCCC